MERDPSFLYTLENYDASFPYSPFDPKAVTRASYCEKPLRLKPNGPLLSFDARPDTHTVSNERPRRHGTMTPCTKQWIKGIRLVQLALRLFELGGAIGILVLAVLISHMAGTTALVFRVTAAVAILHTLYGIHHFARPAIGRAPGSTATYQLFAGIGDLVASLIYFFGAVVVHTTGQTWTTAVHGPGAVATMESAMYSILLVSGVLHIVSLFASFWLGWMFRKISQMPPDMNPLENNLTSRTRHKKKQSSLATISTISSQNTLRLTTSQEDYSRDSTATPRLPRLPSLPSLTEPMTVLFSHGSASKLNLPSLQYQVEARNVVRGSFAAGDIHEQSGVFAPPQRGTYHGIPLDDGSRSDDRSSILSSDTYLPHEPRMAKFTENWTASEPLEPRTQRLDGLSVSNEARGSSERRQRASKSYEALTQRYNFEDTSESEDESKNTPPPRSQQPYADSDLDNHIHPEPLSSNPSQSPPAGSKTLGPLGHSMPPSRSRVKRVNPDPHPLRRAQQQQAEHDGSDQIRIPGSAQQPRPRNSSIQPESHFYSKPYGELKSATPPIMVGSSRKVSSGNDVGIRSSTAFTRRLASGKTAEEGRAGTELWGL